ncbi:MFS transporter [Paraburkholderia fynbosensis]|uniref:Tartrate transporter n=1 Tax=Paraburkholderia fynbosensis TaxID=1200993 RepID=A0A6J5H4A2_9BURK|nr:MFS transporter [Paraburkholderia fynbosensis]CAB3810466.1 Putative tartrate transporter [Paraburkholderia fynbosensis]
MDMEFVTMRQVMRRLMPLVIACYFVAYLDRVNVSFAALQMNRQLSLSASAYGFGAGLFFITYLICEIPSNLAMHRFGARRWISRIMLTWGICAMGMAFVQGPKTFFLGRGLLGAAEAGLNPGMLLYFTLWFPARYRARMTGYLYVAVPLSIVVGAPLSGLLLTMNGLWGLAGWQWMFLLEGLPAVLLSFYVFAVMADRPSQAKWLSPDRAAWLEERISLETRSKASPVKGSLKDALTDWRVLWLGIVFFSDVALNNAIGFYLPQIVKSFGLTYAQTGFVSAIPGLIAIVCMILWCRHSDRHEERKWHSALPLVLGGLALIASTLFHEPVLRMIALTLATIGTLAFVPIFWTIPSSYFTGAAAAAGLAAISSIGILGGAVAPWLVGIFKDLTGSFNTGQSIVGAFAVLCGIALLIARTERSIATDQRVADGT